MNGGKGLIPPEPGAESFGDAFDRLARELSEPPVVVPVGVYGVPIFSVRYDIAAKTNNGVVLVDWTWRARGSTT